MELFELKPTLKKKRKKRLGRGTSSGHGRTCTRGTKGQKARKSPDIPKRFEGGQTPLVQRLPKIGGFRSLKVKPQAVSFRALESKFKEGDKITPKTLEKAGLIKDASLPVKIIGKGEKKFTFEGVKLTRALAKLFDQE